MSLLKDYTEKMQMTAEKVGFTNKYGVRDNF